MKNIALPSDLKVNLRKRKPKQQDDGDWLWLREVSYSGWILMVLTLLLIASAYSSMRIPVGGLLLHLYLLPLVPLFILYSVKRLDLFPKKILFSLLAFVFLFFSSIAVSGSPDTRFALGEIFKVGASVATIVTFALMIRTKFDFRIAIMGVCIAAAVLSIQNILSPGTTFESAEAAEQIETVANKNAFSLYVLPALLLGSFVVLDRSIEKVLRLALLLCLIITTIAIFGSANRSGWLGAMLIGVLVVGRGRSIKALLLIIVLALCTYYALTRFIGTSTMELRVSQTTLENQSEETRIDLLPTCFEIAYENPFIGISPQEVIYEIGRRMPDRAVLVNDVYILDTHNVFAYIAAGSGFPTLFALILLGWIMWKRPEYWQEVLRHVPDAKDGHTMLRVLILLWILRGMFTREILYSPGFNMAFGLCIGLCISQGLWTPKAIQFYRLKLLMKKFVRVN